MHNFINNFLNSYGSFNLDIKRPFTLNDKNNNNLTIIYSDIDNDIHLIPFIDDNKNFSECYFSYIDFPFISKSLIILIKAIELDTAKSNNTQEELFVENYENLLNEVSFKLEDISIKEGLTYSVVHDDFENNYNNVLELKTYEKGVSISVKDINGVRFRTKYGGGKKYRIRNALKLICYLISKEKV